MPARVHERQPGRNLLRPGRDLQTGSTTNENGTTNSFEQEAIGIGLNVRPRITKERNVAMSRLLDVVDRVDQQQPSSTVDRPRPVSPSRTTIVTAGIRRDQDTVRKVLFGDIPGLGALHQHEQSKELTETVIFVTPVVVDNPDENDLNYNVEDVRRLDELSKPLDEMAEDLVNTQFFDRMEDEEGGNDSPESGETPSTETTKE